MTVQDTPRIAGMARHDTTPAASAKTASAKTLSAKTLSSKTLSAAAGRVLGPCHQTTRAAMRHMADAGSNPHRGAGCEIAARKTPSSSRRTPGPIPRCPLNRTPAAETANQRRWLWVPAFAGTTSWFSNVGKGAQACL